MLYIAIISYIPQIHQLTSGKCYHFSYFFVIFEGQRKIQSPRLLSHENHRGDKFLFFRHGRPSPQSKTSLVACFQNALQCPPSRQTSTCQRSLEPQIFAYEFYHYKKTTLLAYHRPKLERMKMTLIMKSLTCCFYLVTTLCL